MVLNRSMTQFHWESILCEDFILKFQRKAPELVSVRYPRSSVCSTSELQLTSLRRSGRQKSVLTQFARGTKKKPNKNVKTKESSHNYCKKLFIVTTFQCKTYRKHTAFCVLDQLFLGLLHTPSLLQNKSSFLADNNNNTKLLQQHTSITLKKIEQTTILSNKRNTFLKRKDEACLLVKSALTN